MLAADDRCIDTSYRRRRQPDLVQRSRDIGLDVERFTYCLTSGLTAKQVQADATTARELGLHGTPVFLIGTRNPEGSVRVRAKLTGARPFEEFQKALDSAMSRAQAGKFVLPVLAQAVSYGRGVVE